MAKRKVIGAKGKGFLGNGSGQSAVHIRGEGDLKKRDVYSMFLLMLGYHKCIATQISHA